MLTIGLATVSGALAVIATVQQRRIWRDRLTITQLTNEIRTLREIISFGPLQGVLVWPPETADEEYVNAVNAALMAAVRKGEDL